MEISLISALEHETKICNILTLIDKKVSKNKLNTPMPITVFWLQCVPETQVADGTRQTSVCTWNIGGNWYTLDLSVYLKHW